MSATDCQSAFLATADINFRGYLEITFLWHMFSFRSEYYVGMLPECLVLSEVFTNSGK